MRLDRNDMRELKRRGLTVADAAKMALSAGLTARWAKALGYHPVVWVQHALQAEVDAAGLKLRVTVEAA